MDEKLEGDVFNLHGSLFGDDRKGIKGLDATICELKKEIKEKEEIHKSAHNFLARSRINNKDGEPLEQRVWKLEQQTKSNAPILGGEVIGILSMDFGDKLDEEIKEVENWLALYKECQAIGIVRYQEGRLDGLKFCMQLLVHGEPKTEDIEPKIDKQESEICRICGLEIDLSKPDDWTFENIGSGKVHRWCWAQKFKDYMNW